MIIKRNLIFLPALLMDMSTNGAILGMTFYASKLGASSLIIGITASISTFLYVVFSRVFGKLSDRVGRKRVPQIASLCFSILYFLMPNIKSLQPLVIFFPLTGFFLSAFWSPYEAWIGEISDGRPLEKRVRMFNLAWTIGVMIGNAISGYAYEWDYRIPFYFASCGSFIAMVIVSLHSKPIVNNIHNENLENGKDENDIPSYMKRKFLYMSWIAIFFAWVTLGVLRYIFPKLINDLGILPRYYGILMLIWSGTQVFMFYILGATKKWHYKIEFSIVCQMLGCIGFFIIYITNYPIFWGIALVFFGIQTGMVYFSSLYYSLCGHTDTGNKSGWHESILSSGAFIGPFIAGAMAKYIGIKSPYMFCVFVILTGLLTQFFLMRSNWFKKKIGSLNLECENENN